MGRLSRARDDVGDRGPVPHVELLGIGKDFHGVPAVRDVDLRIARGSIHALVGENGAGKSTLGKIVAGVHQPTRGELRIDGARVRCRTPREALAHGITVIEQELALVPTRSVLENVMLRRGSTALGVRRRRDTRAAFLELLDFAGFALPPDALVGDLGLADRQKVEILRAVARRARLVVMDEPTAALDRREAQTLHELIRRLRDRGITVVYVSHFLEEVLALADTVTVLRDGRLVRTGPAAAEDVDSLVQAMLGRALERAFPVHDSPSAGAAPVCRVRGLSHPPAFADVDLDVHAGELLGLAGLVGSGRTEIARAISGAAPAVAGTIELDGAPISVRHPRDGLRAGIAMVPESRKDEGLVLGRSVAANITLANRRDVSVATVIDRSRERSRTRELMAQLDIRPRDPSRPVATLSGGNQQKVLFAKSLCRRPRLLIVDEPTRGVDIGAKLGLYDLLVEASRSGMAVLVISSDLDELLGLCHRVLVVRGGRIVGEFPRARFDKEAMLAASLGAEPGDVKERATR